MFGSPPSRLRAPALVRFVAGLTGLHLAVLPAPSPGRAWNLRRLVTGCRAHAPRAIGTRRNARCQSCARTQLRRALADPYLGNDFEGRCGVRTFLVPVAGDAGPAGLLALRSAPGHGPRQARARDARDRRRDLLFRRAMALLRSMARELASSADGNGHAAGIGYAPGVRVPEDGAARRTNASASRALERRSLHAVRAVMDRVQREFAEPLVLKHLARESGLNPSYLSTVFARETGHPFKSYLTAVRLERAQVLLSDPRLRISGVSREVGYATPHRFRAAFRARTGLSPGRWRARRLIERER